MPHKNWMGLVLVLNFIRKAIRLYFFTASLGSGLMGQKGSKVLKNWVPVIDRRHQTGGRFTRDQFRYEPRENSRRNDRSAALLSISNPSAFEVMVLLHS